MFYSIDLGGSTVDVLEFNSDTTQEQVWQHPPAPNLCLSKHMPSGTCAPALGGRFIVRASLESMEVDKNDLEDIFAKANIDYTKAKKIILTGGHSRIFSGDFMDISIEVIPEIEAIGKGGIHLAKKTSGLVCSLGTGTCFVSVKNGKCTHVGGTGVGGGTLMGLCRKLFPPEKGGEGGFSFTDIQHLVEKGDTKNVDLLVKDIVGEGIGMVPETATASNLARLSGASKKADIAQGVANMVGQTIASLAVFAARTHEHENIILGGKLIRLPQIVEIAKKTAAIYGRNIIVPKDAEYLSAVGAGV